MKYGSFIKLYEYQVDNRNRTNITLDLYNRLSLLMPSLALPVRLYERREGYTGTVEDVTPQDGEHFAPVQEPCTSWI